jgi:phosphatidylinositol 4-kinase
MEIYVLIVCCFLTIFMLHRFYSEGRLVHIDFGFILETSPGGNMRFESAQFKLSHEMTQLIDPSGSMRSESWDHFVR